MCKCTKNIVSKLESEIFNWLISISIKCEQSNRKQIYPKELDIYIPDHNLAIEFDGLYWHSEEKGTPKKFHVNKTNLCESKGIQLLHIFENEWVYQKDIVKSIILSKLNIYNKTIYARHCQIKEIDDSTYERFISLNHLKGYSIAKYKIGLFYNNELVQVCSFSKSRFNPNEIEIIRSCSLLNTQIIGGFNKIVKYFVNKYKPIKLISYVDRRYFDGHSYKKWSLETVTNPNYWYINKHGLVENRLKYQKYKLSKLLESYDSNKTEIENMRNNGFTRIWDCGNLKFKYEA